MNTLPTAILKKIEELHFFDTCTINTFTSASTTYGDRTKYYTVGSPISFGVKNDGGGKSYSPDGITKLEYDYTIRISLDETCSKNDRITILTKSSNTVNQTVDIVNLQVGVGCKVLRCKLVSA